MGLDNASRFSEQDLILSLTQDGITRRRGEDQLFEQYAYLMHDATRKHSITYDEAYDAYSDAVLSVIDSISNRSFEGRSSIKTYLYQIFHNKCVDLIRKKSTNKYSVHRTVALPDVLHELSDSSKLVIQQLAERADLDLLKQRLGELGENCRKLLTLSAEGNADKEIAVLMDYKSSDVVKTSRLRCLEKLRQLYLAK
jgi:RNA polymerase sigma factor (sigma-70 family)